LSLHFSTGEMQGERGRVEAHLTSVAHRHTLPGEFPDPAPDPIEVVKEPDSLTRTATGKSLGWGDRTRSLVRRVSSSKLAKIPPDTAASVERSPSPQSPQTPQPPQPPTPPVPPELRAALAHLSQVATANGTTSHAARLRWLAYHSLLNDASSKGDDAIVLSPRSFEELEASVAAVASGPFGAKGGEAEVLRAVQELAVAAEAVFAAGVRKTAAAGRKEVNGGHVEKKRGILDGLMLAGL
jgi:hypothetical protein